MVFPTFLHTAFSPSLLCLSISKIFYPRFDSTFPTFLFLISLSLFAFQVFLSSSFPFLPPMFLSILLSVSPSPFFSLIIRDARPYDIHACQPHWEREEAYRPNRPTGRPLCANLGDHMLYRQVLVLGPTIQRLL